MPNTINAKPMGQKGGLDAIIVLGFAAVLMFFIGSGIISYLNTRTLNRDTQLVAHTHEVLSSLDNLLSLMKDAETGQRGFILTGDEKYLVPYNSALANLDAELSHISSLTQDNPAQQARVPSIKANIHAKLKELDNTIELRRAEGFKSALTVILSDSGRAAMETLRSQISQMEDTEQTLRQQRIDEMQNAYKTAIVSGILTCLLGVLLAGSVAYLMRRAAISRQNQEWLQAGEAGLSMAMLGNQRVDQMGENILKFLCEFLGAQAGAFFTQEGSDFKLSTTYGVPENSDVPKRFGLKHGLLGQAAKDGRTFIVHDVPDGYLTVGSALGHDKPRHLIISPGLMDGSVNTVLELGFVQPIHGPIVELLERTSETIGVAVRSAHYRANLQNLLEETQRQAEELQAQSEELRVSNEELEEQSRALKESQTRLEQQQAELEQTNTQLEEQAQQLENQRDYLARAATNVQAKAQELEQASQYKSDFLANMSHELRTPLNSSLILAKLLADNPEGNLTEEQVKFAQTIQSSGNDLLSLINDILDLSKIEAGHMEVRPEPMRLTRLIDDVNRMFQPIAQNRGLAFITYIAPDCPEMVETDRQRFEQILKNLLSNAFKFTERGSVELTISRDGEGDISFAVKDSGIGISSEQQKNIFEAFRQADGTISRKYGGTGLGLSISRQLARLLGGKIKLVSEPGKGSTFTIVIPEQFKADTAEAQSEGSTRATLPPSRDEDETAVSDIVENIPAGKRHVVEDDREKLNGNQRVILVIEDDESFARILYALAHELDFQCLIASSAEDGLVVAKQYLPSAVVLDVGLPDNSGLSVLDRLKRDSRTRHIPVHVVSAYDYSQKALSLGAVGYMLKPVKREELVHVLQGLEGRLAQRMRHVLIVEDDKTQRESMQKLLGSHDVGTVGVGTAAECLEQLKNTTFDCMVLDLSLPDASGYSLLETLSQEDSYSFPPVIVYTGRDLSADEEQKLRRYSKSIIIKGAKSPERLLDEVTLFLHQVVSDLPVEQQKMIQKARNRDAALEGRRILVVEDDVRNVYSLTKILEPRGAVVQIARNGREALDVLEKSLGDASKTIDLVLMDVMMPEMDGMTATRHIRKRADWKKLPVIMLTAKAMKDDQERCLEAGANDYMAKPLDVEKLLSLVRVWMPR